MLVLFETAAGYTLWRVDNEGIITDKDLCSKYGTAKDASKVISFQAFQPFAKTAESVEALKSIREGNVEKVLEDFLKENIVSKGIHEKLQVSEASLAKSIKDNLGIECIGTKGEEPPEIFRLIRSQFENLIPSSSADTFRQIELGVSHELCSEVLKFSPSKVDSMIVHSVNLLEELDKELNNYGMRVREWYGWHFPELIKITTDNLIYAKIVKLMGKRDHVDEVSFDEVLNAEQAEDLVKNAHRSIGTELSDEDLECIQALCDQVIELTAFRNEIADYIRVRMETIAPNLNALVGDTVGSRLIAHAGSLQQLAKLASSTVQIYGAEKALFRAIKEKKKTPKYGYIYHAKLVSSADQKFKGQVARTLAANISLSSRYDSFCDEPMITIGESDRERVENQIHAKEGKKVKFEISRAKAKEMQKMTPSMKSEKQDAVVTPTDSAAKGGYKEQNDFQIAEEETPKKKHRRHRHRTEEEKAAEAQAQE
jgi:nucleolar protein 58